MTDASRIEDFEGLVAHLASTEAKLSRRLRQVAQFVLNNPEDVAIYNIVELARMAGVPTSTITRFTKEVGFTGFAELQAVFRQRLVGPRLRYTEQLQGIAASRMSTGPLDLDDPGAVFDAFIQSGLDTLVRLREETDRSAMRVVIEALASAHAVHIVAARGVFGVGAYCFYGLNQVGKRAQLVDNLGAMRAEQMRFIAPEDVVLAITFDNYTPETLAAVDSAVKAGHRLLSITDNEMSPIARRGLATLYVREARLGHFRSQIPAMALCQSIIVSVGRRLNRASNGG
jgi:DNA-binding MurR/RpiR family transcriptional regulator